MKIVRTILSRLQLLFQRREVKQEIDDELRFHIEQRTAQNVAAGMAPEEAAREARKRFGNFQAVREECRDMRGANFADALFQDIRFGARMLRKNPAFTAGVLATLSLAMGATTVIYSFVHAILLRPLPFKDPNRIVVIQGASKGEPENLGAISLTDLNDWRQRVRAFGEVAYSRTEWKTLSGLGEAQRLRVLRVSSNFFGIFGVKPACGRVFEPNEDSPGNGNVVIASAGFWKRELGGQTDVLGQTLRLEGEPYTLVGVMPDEFSVFTNERTGRKVDLWIPAAETPDWFLSRRHDYFHEGLARLAPGVSIEGAQAELDGAMDELAKKYPQTNADRTARLFRPRDYLVRNVEPALKLLFAAVGLVVLIASANVANLLLARALAREREMAVRTALGAGRKRIVQQLLTESILLGLMGGVIGLAMAWGGSAMLRHLAPPTIPRLQNVQIDFAVLGFTFLVAAATGVVFGLFPAWHSGSKDPGDTLKTRTAGATTRSLSRNVLVVFEVALAVILLTGAGLLTVSLLRLEHVRTGFDADQLTGVTLRISISKYPADRDRIAFYDHLLERVKSSLPETSAAVAMYPPFGIVSRWWHAIEGRESGPSGNYPLIATTMVSDDYFKVMGAPVLRGRAFTEQDGPKSQLVVIINEAFARRWFPNEDPIGKRMRIESPPDTLYTIVGVVGNTRQFLDQEPQAQSFRSYRQYSTHDPTLVVRGGAGSVRVVGAIREAVTQVDTDAAIGDVRTFNQMIGQSAAEPRFRTVLLVLLASLALVLAAVGIYAVLAYTVKQRTNELGIRVALGAKRIHVFGLVIGHGMRLALVGTALGVIGAMALTRLLKNMLFEIGPYDPIVFAAVSFQLLVIAFLACWIPARRATRIDPMTALRYE